MSNGSRQVDASSAGTSTPDDEFVADGGSATDVGRPSRSRILLEYVTFGYGFHHLLKVVVLQFAILFLDVGLLGYTRRVIVPGREWFVTAIWLVASFVFLCLLVTLVRQIGRRTLTPRFHRRVHLAGSVVGYLATSGLSFAFGYATFVLPGREAGAVTLPELLPAGLLILVFSTFIAIGYHAQVDVTDQPKADDITEVVAGWLDALSWATEESNSLAREVAYAEFVERTDDLAAVLSHARTVEARRLEADFLKWREQFETHSMLTRELIVEGRVGDDAPESDRLAAEHEAFIDLRRRLVVIAEISE